MSYYMLGREIYSAETHLKIAVAENEQTAKMIVMALNANVKTVDRQDAMAQSIASMIEGSNSEPR
jgi:hypothetical protein